MTEAPDPLDGIATHHGDGTPIEDELTEEEQADVDDAVNAWRDINAQLIDSLDERRRGRQSEIQ